MKRIIITGILYTLLGITVCYTQNLLPEKDTTLFVDKVPKYMHYFEGGVNKVMFKSIIELGRQEFSGILVVKIYPGGEFISVFTTETGFKIFEISFSDSGYELKFGIGVLKKKMIAKRLAMTVQVITIRPLNKNEVVVSHDENNQTFTITKLINKGYFKMSVRDSSRVLGQSVFNKSMNLKAAAEFTDFNIHNIPDSVSVLHVGFPIQAYFRRLPTSQSTR